MIALKKKKKTELNSLKQLIQIIQFGIDSQTFFLSFLDESMF